MPMSRHYFGTDGVRGVANAKLTPELAFRIGQAAGRLLLESNRTPRAAIGMDTRRSGPMLCGALTAGFASVGIDCVDLGVVPTPTVSHAARTLNFGLGAMISASHNPAPDNGIKLMGPTGHKLPDTEELRIEALMEEPLEERPTGEGVGRVDRDRGAIEDYLRALEAIVPEGLAGMRVAVDAAHGAAYELAPEILVRLGAEVVLTGGEPDGMNINAEGGATRPERIQALTRDAEAAIGVAFDGDADRAVFSDERGRLINGDRTLGIWSAHQMELGALDPAAVVGTVMSNGGFERHLRSCGIELHRTPVGDKYVSEKMRETGALIGGEQSGHIIFARRGPTGDGLVTMLELLQVLRASGRSASEFYAAYEPWPQLLVNVSVRESKGWNEAPRVAEALREAEAALDGNGRVVVRPSGTQPMIRVMVEAENAETRDRAAERIVDAMRAALDGEIYSRVDLTHALGD